MNKPSMPSNTDHAPYRNPKSNMGATLIIASLVVALLPLALPGCSSTKTYTKSIDQTDKRTAVQTEDPDTIRVDSIRTDTVWMPGATITWPETVKVAEEAAPTDQDTAAAFPLQEIAVDSANVRLTGLTEEYTVPHPCFGERLIGRSVRGDVSFRVTGDCVPRDTVVQVRVEEQSWFDRTLDKIGRWISLVALLGIGLYILWGTITTTVSAVLPW